MLCARPLLDGPARLAAEVKEEPMNQVAAIGEGPRTAQGDAVAAALSTENHRLLRTAPDGVGCSCGQYGGADEGEDAGEAWREHLIEVARRAIEETCGWD